MKENVYLHGYSRKEQTRLIDQADFLEPYVYSGVDLEFCKHLLEVGCGVGAQTKILARRFPKLKIDSVDISAKQLLVAKEYLQKELQERRVRLFEQDAQNLKMQKRGSYDAAFLCWFLEHVPEPLKVLKSTRQQLQSGAKIFCSEVFNQTFFMEPYCPAYLKYWFEFNDYQWTINGHPFVGSQLGNLLKDAGYVDIQTEVRPFHFDSRNPEKRKAFAKYFFDIALSAKDTLLAEGRVDKKLIRQMEEEVHRVALDKNAVFFYAFMRATARVP